MTKKLSIRDLDLAGRRVFVRCDFNVPLDGGRVADDTRLVATLPTLRLGLERGARLVLASHLGRPKGPDPALSLAPVAARLAELVGRPVGFCDEVVGEKAEAMAKALGDGELLLIENLRFEPGETKNDPELARRLAALAERYVNDAFGAAHRAHASTVGMVRHFDRAAAGLLMEKELHYLGMVLGDPPRPFVALLGGAKVSDKIEVVTNLLARVDRLLVGGGMAYTFLRARGLPTGRSLVEEDKVELAREILERAGDRLALPVDHVVAPSLDEPAAAKTVPVTATPEDWMGLDIGPETIRAYAAAIAEAKTVLWNGPMGVFEKDAFARGTVEIARAVAASGATSIVGGGDSVAAVHKAGVADRITHISTGGGASLEFLAGRSLPGVEVLTDA